MRRILRFLALLVLSAPVATVAAQGAEPRLLAGRAYAADGSATAGVKVRVRGEVYEDSLRLDSTGVFSFRVPRWPVGPVELVLAEEGGSGAFLPMRLRLTAGERWDGLSAVLVPRVFTIPAGSYAGRPVEIDVVGATTRACARCAAYYRSLNGDDKPGRRPGVPTWPESAFPLHVAIDPEVGPRMSPRDSLGFWKVADAVQAAFGRALFEPASIDEVLDPPEDDERGVVIVNVNPSLPGAEGWGNTAAQGGDLLAAAVMMRRTSDFSGPGSAALVAHELLHGLGFGHTCAWRSVVAAEQCPGRRAGEVTAEDVAHALVLWRVRALERRLGVNQTVNAVRAAAGLDPT